MDVGFNYPWPRNQVITIGPNVNERGKPHPWRAEPSDLDVNLARLRAAGITVVRIWLMGHGHNYDGVVTRTSRLVGHDWEFQPPPALHPLFAEDFTALLAKFAKAGLKMIPVLLDYSFFDEPEQLSRPAFGPEPTRTALNYMRGRRA
ncbi:MAG TPA: hypothetical protein VFV66_30685, partial [Nonomuraea sp.]|nr:hypothetical protein [Nonomuraea sp.]